MLKKGDILLILAVLCIAILWFCLPKLIHDNSNGIVHRIAVIKQNNKEIKRIDLDSVNTPVYINVDGEYKEKIVAEKGRIRFESADCPDKRCVKTGWLIQNGEMAVCIPNRTSIKIIGENNKVDGVTF